MIELVERPSVTAPPVERRPSAERAARRSLLLQVEHLERELARLFSSAWPRQGLTWRAEAPHDRRPHLLDLGELERLRDALACRVEDARRDLSERHEQENAYRSLVEDMLSNPAEHRWERVSHADIGEPGCRHWHVLPRWGLLGMLGNWWRVKISSGCPLASAH